MRLFWISFALLLYANVVHASLQVDKKGLQCPHKTQTINPVMSNAGKMMCSLHADCPKDTICVWGKKAANAEEHFGMCCAKEPYEADTCTANLLDGSHNKDTGVIDPTIANADTCKKVAQQRWGTIDTGAGGIGEDQTSVCCKYPVANAGEKTCQGTFMGITLTGTMVEDTNSGRGLPCKTSGKKKDGEPKVSCGDNRGFCFAIAGDPANDLGVCCDIELCPDGITPLSAVAPCDDSCNWKIKVDKDKYCPMSKLEERQKCCPAKFIPQDDGKGGKYERDMPEDAIKLNAECKDSGDCGGYGAFCAEDKDGNKYCHRIGSRDYGSHSSGKSCHTAAGCVSGADKKFIWWCVPYGDPNEKRMCVTPGQKVENTNPPVNRTLLWVACIIWYVLS